MNLLAQVATVALAVTLNTAGATPQKTQPQGYTPEADAILREMIETYAAAETYLDSGQLTVLQQTGRVRQITKMPTATALDRSNPKPKLHVLGGMQSISTDGEQLQIVLDALKQFQQRPAPSRLEMEDVRMGAPGAGLEQGYPEILEFLLGDEVLERWTAQMRSIEIKQPSKIAGHECDTISYQTVHGAEINLFIDAEAHILLRCDIDNTDAQRSANAPPSDSAPPTLQVVLQFAPVELDSAISANLFAVEKPAGMRQVEVFQAEQPGQENAPPPAPEPLIGKAAPAIPDQDFDDRPTLLFFWSPNAGPGNLAAIQMVERLRVGAEESGVAFFGLAAAGADLGIVTDLLAAKKASYKNTIDSRGDIARAYQIDSLPAFVLVGADGNIHHTASGDPIAAEAELASQLRNLKSK